MSPFHTSMTLRKRHEHEGHLGKNTLNAFDLNGITIGWQCTSGNLDTTILEDSVWTQRSKKPKLDSKPLSTEPSHCGGKWVFVQYGHFPNIHSSKFLLVQNTINLQCLYRSTAMPLRYHPIVMPSRSVPQISN